MKERLKEFEKELTQFTAYSLEYKEIQLKLIRSIINNLADPLIQAVLDWQGDRDTSYCTDYYELPKAIVEKYSGGWDSYCSSGWHDMVGFVSDVILFIAEQNKGTQLRIKKEKIKQLKEEARELEQALIEAEKDKV